MIYSELSMLFTNRCPGPVGIVEQYQAAQALRMWHVDSLKRRQPGPSLDEVESTEAVFDAICATLLAEGRRQGVLS